MASRSAFGRDKNNGMPGSTRTQQKAEAKYNVTTEYPRYDLHFAAASGNLGLVEFALSHGQPINSVLNGVLPLHAACAGGNEVVVRYLIEEGADVNAPRLPRRYSNEKHRTSGLAVGASGSTPLHFAAANGHMAVVRLLLEHGAAPDRADKHGVTPQMLARENGWVECAELLEAWKGSREGDLPPINGHEVSKQQGANQLGPGSEENGYGQDEKEQGCTSKRLQVKRSIDNALHLFRNPLHHYGSHGQLRERERQPSTSRHHHSHSLSQQIQHQDSRGAISLNSSNSANSTSDASYTANDTDAPSLGEYHSFFSLSPTANTNSPTLDASSYQQDLRGPLSSQQQMELPPSGDRRPSLPHIFPSSVPSIGEGVRRRPRSASSDNEQHPIQLHSQGIKNGIVTNASKAPNLNAVNGSVGSVSTSGPAASRKLSSKISLRNLFRRAGGDSSLVGSEPSSAANSYSASSSAPLNAAGANKLSQTPTPPASPLGSSFSSSTPPPSSYSNLGIGRRRSRLGSDGSMNSLLPTTRSPLIPSAVELHHRYSQEFAPVSHNQSMISNQSLEAPKISSRPSILRGLKHPHHYHHHNRSASAQSANVGRTLRFDNAASSVGSARSSSSNLYGSQNSEMLAGRLRASRSASSLRHAASYDDEDVDDENDEDEYEDYGSVGVQTRHRMDLPESAPAKTTGYSEGELIQPSTTTIAHRQLKDKSLPGLAARYMHINRARGDSFTSNASSSPGVSPENMHAPYADSDFPFSIERPPLTPVSTNDVETGMGAVELHEEEATESRLRGESFSSVGTDKTDDSNYSGNVPSQGSLGTDGTDLTTPSPGDQPTRTSIFIPHNEFMQASFQKGAKASIDDIYPPLRTASPTSSLSSEYSGHDDDHVHDTSISSTRGERQEHNPSSLVSSPFSLAPLDLSKISNLAEAEALVQRAEQAIKTSASLPQDGPGSPSVPLSVQLAAYGEILALERRFARGEKQRLREKMSNAGSDSEGGGVQEREELGRLRNRSGSGGTGVTRPKIGKEDLTRKDNISSGERLGVLESSMARSQASRSVLHSTPKSRRYRRPHTAEGAPHIGWGGDAHNEKTLSGSLNQGRVGPENTTLPQVRISQPYSHSRSSSTPTPLIINNPPANIEIIETTATPLDSPEIPDSASAARSPTHMSSISITPRSVEIPRYDDSPHSRYTIDDVRPTLPFRAQTPEPVWAEKDQDRMPFSTGIPLTRVATAPLSDIGTSYGSGGSLSKIDAATRRSGKSKKLAKMGFGVDSVPNMNAAYSPGSSAGSSRSPSKARFGGIKSLVRGLKGKQ